MQINVNTKTARKELTLVKKAVDLKKKTPRKPQENPSQTPNVDVDVDVDNKEKVVKEKSLSLSDRTKNFKNELIPFVEEYGKDMIRAFFDYWSEPNTSGTKMRYEMQKTWNLAGRLRTWERRSNEKR